MNSHEELTLRNAIYKSFMDHRFSPDLYPILNDEGYYLTKTDEIYDIINEIMLLIDQNDINLDDFPKGQKVPA